MNDRREKNMEKRKEKLKELGINIEPTKVVIFWNKIQSRFFFLNFICLFIFI